MAKKKKKYLTDEQLAELYKQGRVKEVSQQKKEATKRKKLEKGSDDDMIAKCQAIMKQFPRPEIPDIQWLVSRLMQLRGDTEGEAIRFYKQNGVQALLDEIERIAKEIS